MLDWRCDNLMATGNEIAKLTKLERYNPITQCATGLRSREDTSECVVGASKAKVDRTCR